MNRSLLKSAIGVICLCLFGASVRAAELSVAAAADLKFALDELVTEFQTKHPSTTVKVTYGSSGNFYAQLQNKAPFDLYFSADIVYPRKLAEAGLALDRDVFLYAVGRIVVWTPSQSPVKLEQLGIQIALRAVREKNRHRQSGARALRRRGSGGLEIAQGLRTGRAEAGVW